MSLRLSSRQITLLLSSLWAQAMSPNNGPENYEAIAHTYSLMLLFSRAKVNTITLWFLYLLLVSIVPKESFSLLFGNH